MTDPVIAYRTPPQTDLTTNDLRGILCVPCKDSRYPGEAGTALFALELAGPVTEVHGIPGRYETAPYEANNPVRYLECSRCGRTLAMSWDSDRVREHVSTLGSMADPSVGMTGPSIAGRLGFHNVNAERCIPEVYRAFVDFLGAEYRAAQLAAQ